MTLVGVHRAIAKAVTPNRRRLACCAATIAALAAVLGAQPAAAEDAEIAHRRAIERKTFTDAEIVDGFFKVTFGAEFHVAGGVDRIRKYDGPVRVYIDNRAKPDRSAAGGRGRRRYPLAHPRSRHRRGRAARARPTSS